MLLNGVDIPGLGGWLTAVHSDEDIERTVAAVGKAIEVLKGEGMRGVVSAEESCPRKPTST